MMMMCGDDDECGSKRKKRSSRCGLAVAAFYDLNM
jgi:hypothetical protein